MLEYKSWQKACHRCWRQSVGQCSLYRKVFAMQTVTITYPVAIRAISIAAIEAGKIDRTLRSVPRDLIDLAKAISIGDYENARNSLDAIRCLLDSIRRDEFLVTFDNPAHIGATGFFCLPLAMRVKYPEDFIFGDDLIKTGKMTVSGTIAIIPNGGCDYERGVYASNSKCQMTIYFDRLCLRGDAIRCDLQIPVDKLVEVDHIFDRDVVSKQNRLDEICGTYDYTGDEYPCFENLDRNSQQEAWRLEDRIFASINNDFEIIEQCGL